MKNELLEKQLKENKNADQIKQTIRQKMSKIENLIYHQFVSDQKKFMEYLLKMSVEPEKLSILDELMNQRFQKVASSIEKGELELPFEANQTTTSKLSPLPSQARTLSIYLQNHEEYPISSNYEYWSTSNSKSIETKEYIRRRQEQDRRVRDEIINRRMAIEQAKRLKEEAAKQQQSALEQKRREQIKDEVLANMTRIKQRQEERVQQQNQFKRFLKQFKTKQPIYIKMEQQYHEKIETPLLQQHKLKLQQLRKLRTPSLAELQEHARKYDETIRKRNSLSNRSHILNQPIKVSYRSKFHGSFDDGQPSSPNPVMELMERKKNYGRMVKEEFMPVVSLRLVEEIQQRFEPKHLLNKRHRNKTGNEKEQDEKSHTSNSEEDSSDEEEKQPEPEDQEPQNVYRNRLGNEYLGYVKKLKKKPGPNLQQRIRLAEQMQKQEKQRKQVVVRPNYLEDLKRIRSQSAAVKSPLQSWQSDIKNSNLDQLEKRRRVLMKSQRMAELAHRKQLVLSHNKLNQKDTFQEHKKIDSQYLQAIRAKLALMQV